MPLTDTAGNTRIECPICHTTYKEGERHGCTRDPLLNERQTTHGDFEQNAYVSQQIKKQCRATNGWHQLHPIECEAMDMIALKFSRILSGKSLERQHWEDVVGYAKLVLEQCK